MSVLYFPQAEAEDRSTPGRPELAELPALVSATETKAKNGDPNSQYLMGMYLLYGTKSLKAEAPDYRQIKQWFELAAQKDHVGAKFELGRMYSKGLGVQKDEVKARQYWLEGAKKGYPAALGWLGSSFWNSFGDGAPQDWDKAVILSQKAAELKDPAGLNSLATAYWNGNVLRQDYAQAYKLLVAAAERGLCEAMANIGGMYYNGDGVPQNAPKAQEWFAKAKECDKQEWSSHARLEEYLNNARTGHLPKAATESATIDVGPAMTLAIGVAVLAAILDHPSSNAEGSLPCDYYKPIRSLFDPFTGERFDGRPCY
jgi:TPR repeat protein